MSRSKGIVAYGTQEDRKKLEIIARIAGQSQSEWLISQIRKAYREIYGNTSPDFITLKTKGS